MEKPKFDLPTSVPPTMTNEKSKRGILPLVALVVLLCATSAAVSFYFARRAAAPLEQTPPKIVQPANIPLVEQPKDDSVGDGVPTAAEQEALLNDQRWHVAELKDFTLLKTGYASGVIEWQAPTASPDFGGFSANVPGAQPNDAMTAPDAPASPFLVGTVKKGTYAGYGLYVSDFACDGPCSFTARFLSDRKTVVLLGKYSEASAAETVKQYVANAGTYAYKTDDTFDIPEMDFPKTLTVGNPKVTLSAAQDSLFRFPGFFSPKPTDKPEFDVPDHGSAYRRDAYGTFVVQAPDGTPQQYVYDLDFLLGKDGVPKVTWNDGKANTAGYGYRGYSGCGLTNYAQVVNLDEANLSVAGKLAGTSVYVLKDPKDPTYSTYYENVYYAPDGQKMSFDDFVAARPFFYWKDAFGRLVQFTNVTFQSQAECGKPVIYLYPTKTTDVSVRVAPTGGMTKSDPAYGNGWEVTAHPDGQMEQKGTGSSFPYLFWEGRSDSIWQMPNLGFSVAQADVPTFLDAKLAALGLNGKEIADFKEFWLPRFKGHPYYFVTFMGNGVMDRLAPLTVLPKPDTVIRVLMDFKGLDAPVAVRPQILKTPNRTGFTVVEWGGVIH